MQVMGRYPCGGGENVPFLARPENEKNADEGAALCALLDNVRSTWNVGSMLRTADGAGMEHVYLCGITPPGDHPKTAAAALGAERSVSWSRHANALRLCMEMKQAGWRLWALESGIGEGSPQVVSIFEKLPPHEDLPEGVLLIAGNERLGVDAHILTECERILSIPMLGKKGSLNVAVAFGIAAYRLRFPR
jgi:23S rRNA (guanosine2251-2'-O)-methyltransferase